MEKPSWKTDISTYCLHRSSGCLYLTCTIMITLQKHMPIPPITCYEEELVITEQARPERQHGLTSLTTLSHNGCPPVQRLHYSMTCYDRFCFGKTRGKTWTVFGRNSSSPLFFIFKCFNRIDRRSVVLTTFNRFAVRFLVMSMKSLTISQRKSLKLKGTKSSVAKNQILISTGIVSLDAVLDGGIPIGTVTLIEEENYGRNADIITKHFIAEGVVCDHSILIADVERKPETIANDLPKSIQEESFQPTEFAEDFKIAWRYKQNPIYDSKPHHTSTSFGHTFDMTTKIPVDELQNIRYWPTKESLGTSYSELLNVINRIIMTDGFSTKIPVEQRHVLRITISNLFSPIWDSNGMDVVTFLYKLRILLRTSYATCLITTRTQIVNNVIKCRVEHFADTVLLLKPMELNTCADYNGKLIISKLASFNTFLYEPLSVDWATKLTRKKLCIEKLHLPPCLNDDDSENIRSMPLSCASTTSVLNF